MAWRKDKTSSLSWVMESKDLVLEKVRPRSYERHIGSCIVLRLANWKATYDTIKGMQLDLEARVPKLKALRGT